MVANSITNTEAVVGEGEEILLRAEVEELAGVEGELPELAEERAGAEEDVWKDTNLRTPVRVCFPHYRTQYDIQNLNSEL